MIASVVVTETTSSVLPEASTKPKRTNSFSSLFGPEKQKLRKRRADAILNPLTPAKLSIDQALDHGSMTNVEKRPSSSGKPRVNSRPPSTWKYFLWPQPSVGRKYDELMDAVTAMGPENLTNALSDSPVTLPSSSSNSFPASYDRTAPVYSDSKQASSGHRRTPSKLRKRRNTSPASSSDIITPGPSGNAAAKGIMAIYGGESETPNNAHTRSYSVATLSSLIYTGHHGYYEQEQLARIQLQKLLDSQHGSRMHDSIVRSISVGGGGFVPPVVISGDVNDLDDPSFTQPQPARFVTSPSSPNIHRGRSKTFYFDNDDSENGHAGEHQLFGSPERSEGSSDHHHPTIHVRGTSVTSAPTESREPLSVNTQDLPDGRLLLPIRPSLSRTNSSNSARRWTVAVSGIADDGEFLKEMDKMKELRDLQQASLADNSPIQYPDDDIDSNEAATRSGSPLVPREEEEVVWMKARKAMLIVREILRTEASYREHLVRVWEENEHLSVSNSPTASPGSAAPQVPSLFLAHLPSLISASKALGRLLDADPSAWGVSAAFLSAEHELEVALVAWCRVVGQVMLQFSAMQPITSSGYFGSESGLRSRRTSLNVKSVISDDKEANSEAVSPAGGLASRLSIGRASRKSSKDGVVPSGSILRSRKARSSLNNGSKSPTSNGRSLNAQDVAIMPSQRIPRYVLLFRDLLLHTPATSPSRSLVERALEAAIRIAKRCDEAQQHDQLQIPPDTSPKQSPVQSPKPTSKLSLTSK